MEKRGKWLFIAIVLLGAVSFLIDTQISQLFESIRGFILDYFFVGFTFEIQVFVILFIITSIFLYQEKKGDWIIPLWISAVISVAMSFIIKIMIHRLRPFQTGIIDASPLVVQIMGNSVDLWNFSFPSFQAMLAFSALPILDKEFKKFRIAWIAIAVIISISRVYFGAHYLSDVIFGGIIGYLIGMFVVYCKKRAYSSRNKKR